MKKQINPTIKAHLIRGAFYLLLLLAVCAIPFALAQPKRQAIGWSAKTACSQRCCFGLGTEVCPQFVSWEVYQRRSCGLDIQGECPS